MCAELEPPHGDEVDVYRQRLQELIAKQKFALEQCMEAQQTGAHITTLRQHLEAMEVMLAQVDAPQESQEARESLQVEAAADKETPDVR